MNDDFISPIAYSVLRALARQPRKLSFFESVAERDAILWLLKSRLAVIDEAGLISASERGRPIGRVDGLDE